jgi:hypothetical protein
MLIGLVRFVPSCPDNLLQKLDMEDIQFGPDPARLASRIGKTAGTREGEHIAVWLGNDDDSTRIKDCAPSS